MKKFLFLLLAVPAFAQSPVIGGSVQYVTTAPSGACVASPPVKVLFSSGALYTCANGTWTSQAGGGGTGTVTNIATTSPIGGGPITTTGTLTCTTCVVSSSPGVGLAHFAGSTQTVTSSAVNLAGADVTGNLPVTNLNSGTSASSSTFWRGDGTWATPSGGAGAMTNITGTVTATGCSVSSGICTVSGGSTTTVSFTSIPGGHSHLYIIMQVIATSGTPVVNMTLNSDSTSGHYLWTVLQQLTTTQTANSGGSATSAQCGGETTNDASSITVMLPFYTGTVNHKNYMCNYSLGPISSNVTVGGTAGNWSATPAAITSVSFAVPTNIFASGSSFTIYAID